jgi:CubicO group peptidase (beta-lactamase class C family)
MRRDLHSLDLLDPRLKPLCEAILGATQVPGASIAVVMGDKSYHHAHGLRSVASGAPREAVTADTGFNIGSCSKAFVSATVASLAAEGLCSWDDPITKWVPEFQLHDPQISAMVTLRDLSANRLGLPRAGLPEYGLDPSFPPESLFHRLKHTPFKRGFRERFGYVNPGHAANAVAAGRITGKRFLPTLRERILAPLGMTGTSGGAATPNELSNLAGWHVVNGGQVVAIDPVFTDQYLASGGMVVCGRDALQWLRLHLGGGLVDGQQVIPREALSECHIPHAVATPGKDIPSLFYPGAAMGAYALGWAVSDLEGHPLVAHSGSDMGVTAMTLLLPKAGIGVAVYGNCNGGGPGTLALAYAIAATLLGLKPRDWLAYFKGCMPAAPPAKAPAAAAEASAAVPLPQDLSIYAGCYVHPGDGPMDIALEGSGLVACLRDGYRLRLGLVPLGGDTFRIVFLGTEWAGAMAGEVMTLKFTVADGQAATAEISGEFQGRAFLREALTS